jgi:hypothetical protein
MTPIEWLLSGDIGVSSKTILSVMTGSKMISTFGPDIPYDNGDFGRCYRLLQAFPEWRARLPEVAAQYPEWGPMVDAWDELTRLYEQAWACRWAESEAAVAFCRRISALAKADKIAARALLV